MILDLLMRSRYRHDYLVAILSARKTNVDPLSILTRQARQPANENLDVLEDKPEEDKAVFIPSRADTASVGVRFCVAASYVLEAPRAPTFAIATKRKGLGATSM